MTRVTNNKHKNRKYVQFHRDWKRLAKERQKKIQHRLRHESIVEPNTEDELNHSGTIVSLIDQLKYWAIENRISMRALDSLLLILRCNGHNELPKSYRTLLNTPRDIELKTIGDSKYWYRGLTECLNTAYSHLNRNLSIKLKFNIDGLPLFNSSQIQFWPILFSVEGILF